MRLLLLGAALSLALSGCGVVHQEMKHPGGAPGALIDKHTAYSTLYRPRTQVTGDALASNPKKDDTSGLHYINAPKQMQVYRAIVAMAMISKVAESTLRDPDDAQAFVAYLTAVSHDINNLAGHLQVFHPLSCSAFSAGQTCKDYEFLFENDLPAMEGHMVRLGVAALPQREAAALLENVTSGNPLGIATSVWDLGKKSIVAGHNAAAFRRSEREIYAAILKPGAQIPSITHALEIIKTADAEKFAITPDHVAPLYFVIRDVCTRLPTGGAKYAERKTACQGVAFAPEQQRYE